MCHGEREINCPYQHVKLKQVPRARCATSTSACNNASDGIRKYEIANIYKNIGQRQGRKRNFF